MGRILLALATLCMVAACSSRPSDADGRAAFVSYISQHYPGTKTVLNRFEKTNGQQRTENGADSYTLFFEANVEFPEGYRTECITENRQFAGFNCGFQDTGGAAKPVDAAMGLHFAGAINFEKLEKGWLPTGIVPTETTPYELVASADYYMTGPCKILVTPESMASRKSPVEPQKNHLRVSASGLDWNGTAIDEVRLAQFLDATAQISPTPLLKLEVEKGGSVPRATRVLKIVLKSAACTGTPN